MVGVYELVLQGDLAHLQKVNTLTSGELLIVSAIVDKTRVLSRDTHLLQLRDIGHVVVSSLPLLFLQLDGDTSHSAPLQSLHQMSDKPGNLILVN